MKLRPCLYEMNALHRRQNAHVEERMKLRPCLYEGDER